MIATSRPILIGALSVGLLTHAVGLDLFFEDEAVQIAGGALAPPPSFGNSFEDMTAGTETPEDANEITEADPPTEDVTDPVEPEETAEETPPEEVQEQPTEIEDVAEDVPVEEMIETEITPLPVETVVPILPMQPTQVQPTEVAQPQPTETLEAVEENTSAVARSLRPKPRTPEFEKKHEPPPQPRQQATTQPRQQPRQQTTRAPQGNNNQDARQGSATGTQQQSSAASTGTGRATQQGNAAVDNYPGKVMRRLSRFTRVNVRSSGTAVVAFRVTGSGGVSSVSLARSSGNAQLDQAAMGIVRRAAPFPAPPPGAQTRFSVRVKGR